MARLEDLQKCKLVIILLLSACGHKQPSAPEVHQNVAPGAPQNFKGFPGEHKVSLSWDPVADADEYLVCASLSSGRVTIDCGATTTETEYVDTSLPQGTEGGLPYFYLVYAENAYGQSPPSNPVEVTLGPEQ